MARPKTSQIASSTQAIACSARPRSRRMSLVAGSMARQAPSGSVAVRPRSRGRQLVVDDRDDDRLLDVGVAGVDLGHQPVAGVAAGSRSCSGCPCCRRCRRSGDRAAPGARWSRSGRRSSAVRSSVRRLGRRARGRRSTPDAGPGRRRDAVRPTAGPRPRAAGVYGIGRSSGRLTRRGGLAQAMPPMVSSLTIVAPQPAAWTCSSATTSRPVLLDRCPDGRQVERAEPAQVDDLGARSRRRRAARPPPGRARPSAASPRSSRRVPVADDRGLADLGDLAAARPGPCARTGPCARRTASGCGRRWPPAAGCRPSPAMTRSRRAARAGA